jgi:hypothetical protein
MVALGASVLGLVLSGACVPLASPPPGGAEPSRPAPEPPRAELASVPSLVAVRARQLVVTAGFLELEAGLLPQEDSAGAERFRVSSPVLRAWVGQRPRSAVELEFSYLGPTASAAPLASGEGRRQLGVELRAQDSCNVVYVMWRIEPVEQLVVSLKQNPGQRQHSECGDRGYVTLQPELTEPLPPLHPGERHVLFAEFSGAELEVQVDGRRRWRGHLPPAAASLDGPVGIRSDNVRYDARLRATSLP